MLSMNTAARKLSAFLKRERIPQYAFAARIGVGDSAVSRFLNGRRIPTLEQAQRIFEETGGNVTPNDWLIAVEEDCAEAAA